MVQTDCCCDLISFIFILSSSICFVSSSYSFSIFSSLTSSLADPFISSSKNNIFSKIMPSSLVQVFFNLCCKWNLLRILNMMSGVRIGSGRVKAASCQATTIFWISLPEKPSDYSAISWITSDVTPSILINFFPV